jgi:hypothetical protein
MPNSLVTQLTTDSVGWLECADAQRKGRFDDRAKEASVPPAMTISQTLEEVNESMPRMMQRI